MCSCTEYIIYHVAMEMAEGYTHQNSTRYNLIFQLNLMGHNIAMDQLRVKKYVFPSICMQTAIALYLMVQYILWQT